MIKPKNPKRCPEATSHKFGGRFQQVWKPLDTKYQVLFNKTITDLAYKSLSRFLAYKSLSRFIE